MAVALFARWRSTQAHALLVVDQFEELFTLNPPHVQAAVADVIGRLVYEADVHVVLSLRDDFLIRCCEQPALAPVLAHLTALLPLSRDALRRAILEPAASLGYRFEPAGLADEMVTAVEEARSALPLLAFAVARLWERRDREHACLTREAYLGIGGVAGALAQHAEEALERIGVEHETIVREFFRNLVTAEGTRAVIDWDELLSVARDRAVGEAVLRELVDARLLTSYEVAGTEGKPGHHRVEVVHESLLTAWPRLVRWRTQDEDSAQMRHQLKQAAALWDEKGRTADLLWSGTAFLEFDMWRQRYAGALTAIEAAFARAMAEQASRRRRLRRLAVTAVIVALTAVALAVGVSRQQAVASARLAEAEARRAEASRLVAFGRLELDPYPTAAVAYATKSLEVTDTQEARLLALEALWRGPVARIDTVPETAYCSRLAFSSDGRTVACSGFSDKIVVWKESGGGSDVVDGFPRTSEVREVRFVPGSDRLATWVRGDPRLVVRSLGQRSEVTLDAWAEWLPQLDANSLTTFGPQQPGDRRRILRRWSLADGTVHDLATWTLPAGLRLGLMGLRPLAVDPTLVWLAYGDGAAVVLERVADTQRPERRLVRHIGRVRELVFDDRGAQLLTVDETGHFCLWSVADGRLIRELKSVPPHRYSLPILGHDGSLVTWTSGDGVVHVWDLHKPADTPELALRRTDVRDVGNQAFDPRGQWLATAEQYSLALWPLGQPHAAKLAGHVEGPVWDLSFSPDSRTLASCARDSVLIWSLDDPTRHKRQLQLEGDGYCFGVKFSPDGRHLAVTWHNLGVYLAPLAGGQVRRVIDLSGSASPSMPVVFDAGGRTLATSTAYAPDNAEMLLRVVDLATGVLDTYPLRLSREGRASDPYDSSGHYLKYLANGRLLIAGYGGIRRWDPRTGRIDRVVQGAGFVALDADDVGRTAVAVMGERAAGTFSLIRPELVVLDQDGRPGRRITTHGPTLGPVVAVDAAGQVVVTGDDSGVVRVGPIDGSEPHLLARHGGAVSRVAVSPDRRWVASASGSEIILWPMPDLSKPPFHTLPYAELMARLRALTNLRVVEDAASVTGYKIEIGPFPGWKDVPTWW